MKTKSQHEKIWDHLISHPDGLTPMDAFLIYGITKLATRVSEMIRAGIAIEKVWETGTSRDGSRVSYMRYKLDPTQRTCNAKTTQKQRTLSVVASRQRSSTTVNERQPERTEHDHVNERIHLSR